jgi:3-oxoacyl-[acyl-carrier-protein] synthase I
MLPLVVSRLSCANALGAGFAATARALADARSGLRPNAFTHDPLATWIGRVDGLESQPLTGALAEFDCRNNRLARLALEQDEFAAATRALRDRLGRARIGVFIGTSTSGILETEMGYRARAREQDALPDSVRMEHQQNIFSPAAFVRTYFELAGPAASVSTACSSSAKVFAQAARFIAAGWCDAAVVGGADSLCYTTLYGFNSLQLLSTEPCRPCAPDRNGISIGEGAGFALLERRAPRAGEIVLRGYGESSDAHHMSSPDPDGAGAERAMAGALRRAGLAPDAIGYVEMHGTGTPANDGVEDLAIHRLFGTRPPVSSTKGFTGHTLGAAGIMNVVIAVAALRHRFAPGTVNSRAVDPALRARVILANEERRIDNALVNAFGFGGNNASLVLGVAA